MNRRKFFKNAAVVSSMSMLPMPCQSSEINSKEETPYKPKFKMGYQLFSIRDEMAKAPIDTLKALKAMGYQDFELYGYEDMEDKFYGFKASEFKKILDDMELTVTSGHYGFADYLDKTEDELKAFVDRCIRGAKTLNNKYITWPWIAPEQRNIETFKRMAPILNLIGEQVQKAGLGFAYHNHGFEFEDHNGENGYDIIINGTDPSLVKLQMDMYWVMHSSEITPKQLVEDHPGRFVMWHIKDMDALNRDYTELGNGSINYLNTLPDPEKSGLDFLYIEQGGNFAINSTKSAEASAQYFKANLQKFL